MNKYFKYEQEDKIITDFSDENITAMYNDGYVFTRKGKGVMDKTRSIRIDLSKFEPSSENRRILRKSENIGIRVSDLPYYKYTWKIGKIGKDFYEEKFGKGTFSANKIKELMTSDESNFNAIITYEVNMEKKDPETVGYCIARESDDIFHYSYPFYDLVTLNSELKNIGMSMMLNAINYAKDTGKKYIYLGSAQRPGDTYKLQFEGLEWFDGKEWSEDLDQLKNLLHDSKK